ncbi:hypothetical protein NECAME_17465, partial [Necator americanus]
MEVFSFTVDFDTSTQRSATVSAPKFFVKFQFVPMVLISPCAKIPICTTPLHEKILTAIQRNIDRNPNQAAFVRKFSSSIDIGYGHLDVSCQVMPNCIEYAVFYLGALLCGGAMSGASAMFTDYELERQFVDSVCKVVITDETHLDKVLLATKRCSELKTIICVRCPKSTRTLPDDVVCWDEVIKTPVTTIPKYTF